MALNFGLNRFVDPNVQIAGNEIPLEAIKTSADKLQDVYLRAQDTDTKTEAAMKQMMLSTDPVARDAAKALYGDFQNRLQQRVQAGDYENMHQATQRDAMNLGVNMQALMNQKKEIENVYNTITAQKDISDPETKRLALERFRASLPKATYNPETGLVDNFDVGNYSVAADYDRTGFVNKLGSGWQADAGGGGNTTYRRTADGLVETLDTNNKWRKVEGAELNKALRAALRQEPGFYAELDRDARNIAFSTGQDLDTVKSNLERQRVNDLMSFAVPKYAFKENFSESQGRLSDPFNVAGGGGGANPTTPSFTQLPSTNFVNNPGQAPMQIDAEGNIIENKSLPEGSWKLAMGASLAGGVPLSGLYENSGGSTTNVKKFNEESLDFKRLKKAMINKGLLTGKEDRMATNKAVADYVNNQISLAQSSISVANTSDQKSVDYFNTKNEAYFGDKTPNNSKNAGAILSGQFTNRTFTDENGTVLTPKQMHEANKGRNLRVIGVVNQPNATLEYGSDYLVATDPETGESKHFLISPDQNTKNSGAYFTNRVVNSSNRANAKETWKDGYGRSFEATVGDNGEYVVYMNGDVKTPMRFNNNQLAGLSQLSPEQSAQVINQYYTEEKQRIGNKLNK